MALDTPMGLRYTHGKGRGGSGVPCTTEKTVCISFISYGSKERHTLGFPSSKFPPPLIFKKQIFDSTNYLRPFKIEQIHAVFIKTA